MNAPALDELQGLWRRSLIAWPDGRRDTATRVHWLQGPTLFGDLRQPADLAQLPHVRALNDLTRQDCLRLADQQGFAGDLTCDGTYFEWMRRIDYQPKGAQADSGSLRWQDDVLIEEGRHVSYIEHWHREPTAVAQPAAGALLRHWQRGTLGILVRCADFYIFARDRALELQPGASLAECVAAAPSVEAARALVDCEISLARFSAGATRIVASTLPYRVGCELGSGLDPDWHILRSEGDLPALRAILSFA